MEHWLIYVGLPTSVCWAHSLLSAYRRRLPYRPRAFRTLQTPPLKKVRSSEWGSSIPKGVSHEKNGSSNSGNVAAARRCVNHVFGRRRSSATKLLPGQLSREIGVARLLGD